MAMFVDHYLVLGLPTGEEGMRLTERKITKAFKARALEVHPDKRPPDQAAAAHSDFQNLTASYQTLIDAKKRQEFNALLLAYLPSQQQRRRRQEQQQQQQWRTIRIPKRPKKMPTYEEEERKKRQKVQDQEKWKKIIEKLSKFCAEMEKELEELEKEAAAAESKSRKAAQTKPSAAETTRPPPIQEFSTFFTQEIKDCLSRPPSTEFEDFSFGTKRRQNFATAQCCC